jgi:hypothetical protein
MNGSEDCYWNEIDNERHIRTSTHVDYRSPAAQAVISIMIFSHFSPSVSH